MSQPYSLGPRQKALYQYTISSKRPTTVGGVTDVTGRYAYQLINIPCYLESTPDASEPMDAGLLPMQNLFVLDRWHFPMGVDIQVGDYFTCVAQPTTRNDLIGLWWQVQANFQPHARLANKLSILAKRLPHRQTSVTVGTASATQTLGSTQGMVPGVQIYFLVSKIWATIDHVVSPTSVVLTASITTQTGETVLSQPALG